MFILWHTKTSPILLRYKWIYKRVIKSWTGLAQSYFVMTDSADQTCLPPSTSLINSNNGFSFAQQTLLRSIVDLNFGYILLGCKFCDLSFNILVSWDGPARLRSKITWRSWSERALIIFSECCLRVFCFFEQTKHTTIESMQHNSKSVTNPPMTQTKQTNYYSILILV